MRLPATSNLLSLILATEDYQRRFTRRLPAPAGEDDRCESGMDALAAVFGRLFPPHSDDFTPTPSDTGEQSSPERTELHHDVTSTTTYSSGAPMEHSDSPLRTPLPMPARIGSAVIALLLLLSVNAVHAATFTSVATGNWHAAATWDQNAVPTSGDDVVIALGHIVTISNTLDAVCASLTVTGELATDPLATAASPLTCSSLLINGIMTVDLGTKSLVVNGGVTVASGASLTHTSGRIYCGNWVSNGYYTPGTWSTMTGPFVELDASFGSGTISGTDTTSFRAVKINGTIAAQRRIGVLDQLNLSAGATLNMGTYLLTGLGVQSNTTMGSGLLKTSNTSSLPIPGLQGSLGKYNFSVEYAAFANQTIVRATYSELTISGSGVKSLANHTSVHDQLNLNGGNINLGARTLTLGIDISSPGILSHTTGHMYGTGYFKRYFSQSMFDYGDPRGFFPMGDGTNARSVSISTINSDLDINGWGGTIMVKHTNGTGFTNITGFSDDGLTVNIRHNMNWDVQSGDFFEAYGLGLRMTAGGIEGLWSLTDLRLINSDAPVNGYAEGSHDGVSGTLTNPIVARANLDSDGSGSSTIDNLFYIGSNQTSNPLPVELTSFSARLRGDMTYLTWTTATELNNFGFEIQRSISANHQDDAAWTVIGFVNGHGNSLSPKNYSFEDPLGMSSGSIYYRLKQIDRDGTSSFSKVVSVNPGRTSFALSQNYPNPFSGATAINYSLESDEQVTLQVYDIMGNLVSTIVEEPQSAGNYVATFDPGTLNLKPGNYILRLTAGNFVENRKMVYVP